jgi:CRP-like cAMP-binding protein
MGEKLLSKDEVIFRQGDLGTEFYQVLEGSVRICFDFGEESDLILTDLKAGDFFGEMAIIENYPRSATAFALEDGTKLQVISPEETAEYLEADPEKALMLMDHIADRIRSLTDDYNEACGLLSQYENGKDESDDEGFIQKMKKHRAYGKVCRRFNDEESEEARRLRKSYSQSNGFAKNVFCYPKGTVLFKQGDSGDCMYGIHAGSVGIYTGFGTPEEKQLTTLDANSFFGEMGMISQEPRSATAITLEDETTVEVINSDDLKELFEKNPPKASMIISHLSHRLRDLTNDYADVCVKLAQCGE